MAKGPYCEGCGLLVGLDCGCPVIPSVPANDGGETRGNFLRLAMQLESIKEEAGVLAVRLRLMAM